MKDIVLTTINAKWIHPSLALRLLKANLGFLEEDCEIIEFALRQPLAEKLEPFADACIKNAPPKIIGISVSIWNHLAAIELLKELEKIFTASAGAKPVIVLGGTEVSHLPPDAEILQLADHVIRGDGEIAFRELCEKILGKDITHRIAGSQHGGILSAYHLYTDEDVKKKLIYVESSRGCPFKCDFCLSALENTIYEFPLEQFLDEMEILINRGVKTFKFLDRSFNINPERAIKIINFFLTKIEQINSSVPPSNLRFAIRENSSQKVPFTVHFEMVPSLFPPELLQALTRFPPGTLRLEIGIQTLNPQVSARINRPSNPEKELEALRFLSEKTNAIIHADLIAGLPGENLASFGSSFDRLIDSSYNSSYVEIQLGILKKLPGAPIQRHDNEFKMRYNPLPPYDIEETSVFSANDVQRIKNFARFWELLVNRKLVKLENGAVFDKFMQLSDKLFSHFGRNWGIDKKELIFFIKNDSGCIVHF